MSAAAPSPGHGADGQENWRGVATEDTDDLTASSDAVVEELTGDPQPCCA